MIPTFEYIPIIGDTTKATLRVVSIDGLTTRHNTSASDRGRLYASLTRSGGTYTLSVYKDARRTSKVMEGTTNATGQYFDLVAENESGLSGRAWIGSYFANDMSIVLMPTFAVDIDVLLSDTATAGLPGWDPEYGLAMLHATAMRQILTDALPAAVPNLYRAAGGIAGFVPNSPDIQLPNIRLIANPDQLRVAQGSLVKALAAEQAEHLAEFREVAEAARARFVQAMTSLSLANAPKEDEEESESDGGVSFGSWRRG